MGSLIGSRYSILKFPDLEACKFPEKAKLNSFPHTKSGLLFSNNSSIIVHNFSFDVISEINRARIDSKNFMKKKYR